MKIGIEANILKHLLKDAYFITGTAYAGKSTMVRLLAERFDGILLGENYHQSLMDAIDREHQPALSYFDTMRDWQEFISRTPEEYVSWLDGCSNEAAELEVLRLVQLAGGGRRMFVDTNISPDMLREISDYGRVAIMLSPQETSVERFFDRPDEDKRFLLSQINSAPDPDAAMRNFKACIALANSPERYAGYANSGFFTFVRDGSLTLEETFDVIAAHFGLK